MPFFADTNVCSKWETDPGVHANWLAEKARLESLGHEYVSCSLVLVELLSRLVKPEPAYFSSDLKSFLFLSKNETARFLPFPAKFALKTALGVDSRVSRFDAEEFHNWSKCVTSAKSREALGNAEVEMDSMLLTYGIDFGKIKRQHEAGRAAFIKRMAYLRGHRRLPSRDEVALGILRAQHVIPQPADADKLADALDAAYHYEIFLLSTDNSYDFGADKHHGDWVDSQLLYYLADPEMYILTDDSKLKKRCLPSPQADRILLL